MASRLTERRSPNDYTPLRVACQLLGDLPWPVMLIDPQLRVTQANHAAWQELPRLDARIEAGLLKLGSEDSTRRLQAILQRLATRISPPQRSLHGAPPRSSIPPTVRPESECLLTDGRERPVAWATAHAVVGATAIAVALHILRPAGPLDAAVLRRRLRLTPAEAAVAALVLAYPRIADLAERLGLSPNTIKNHLKSIFAKCAVRTRAEFAVLLMSIGRA